MQELKKEILKSIVPRAVLFPMNEKAKTSIANEKLISISRFPYKIGRESRVSKNDRGFFVKLRLFDENSTPNNDIYLIDNDELLQISKEHLEITIKDNSFFVIDRGSMNGTTINNETIGGNRKITKKEIKDGDKIKIGSKESSYEFQFLLLEIQ